MIAELTPLDRALELYAEEISALPARRVRVDLALGRVLASDLDTRHALPAHDQSALDGYALRAADTRRADPTAPVRLTVVGEIAAGVSRNVQDLPPHAAWRIYTGAWMPPGADAMIAQEHVVREDSAILVSAPVQAGENVRRRGEELLPGSPVARGGQRLNPGLLASSTAAGHGAVPVHRRPRVAVIVTGDEIAAPGAVLMPGQIHDSNGVALSALLESQGIKARPMLRVADDAQALADAFAEARAADLVVTSGGASVGARDHLRPVATRLGFRTIFWGVAQLPGKPLLFARRPDQLLLGLPGNPAAVVLCAALHLRRVIDLLEGVADPWPRWRRGVLAAPVAPNRTRERLLRVAPNYDENGRIYLETLPNQASHMLANLDRARALARIPAGRQPLAAGSVVDWIPLFENAA